ncbi:MAG: hypothetical protein CMQ70_03295 [Gammaproteobacteria bacterium]|nr:hypothetical protein [Gammaproteobacteria bacterium]
MLPWDKKFLERQDNIKPKTILCGSDGQDIKKVAREIAKSFIASIDQKDYKNIELENIASHNFYFLKKDPEKNNIPIAELREPKDFLSLSSTGKKLLFIQGGEDIRIDGYNSLLKVAEDSGDETFIIISTSNLSLIPPTIKSRFHISRIPKPSVEEVTDFLSTSNQNLSANAIGFLSENPKELDCSLADVMKKMEKYDAYLNGGDIQSKDREEISEFTDYLIYLQKLKIHSEARVSLKILSELMDVKKSISLRNNLSLDVIKLRINSCL